MPKQEEEKNPLDEFVPVGDGVEEEEEEEEEGEEEEEEERLGASEEEEEEEEGVDKKAKRKAERKTRRERQKAARARDEREMGFLRTRNEQLERQFSDLDARVGHGEVAQVDARITDVKSKIQLADQVITKAVDNNDGSAMVEAQGIRDNLRDTLNQLNYAKESMTQSGGAPPSPELMKHAQAWAREHSWWDPNGGDAVSRQVSAIDQQMIREKWDPNTPEYWTELSVRVDAETDAPSNNGAGKKKKKPAGKGPQFSTGGRERPLKKNEVYISPERKTAMVEAGVWDDPDLRQKYLKSYATYDAENRA